MPDSYFGRRLANRYELMESIGKGSMGKVYLAKDTLLGGVPVAVKFLAQTLLNEQMTQRFMHEAMTCAQLGTQSMHVVRVTDYGVTDDEIPFYVMEYLEGQNLGQMLHPRPLPVKRFRDFIRQICLGLDAAHKGIRLNEQVVPIIHRDIKPSNILVTQSASVGDLVKILDFGIAKLMQDSSQEETSTFLGTLAYASPEQMEGQELDHRSDIYSLGIMMYQMLTGDLPFCPKSNTFGGWYNAHRHQYPASLDGRSPYGQLPRSLKDAVMNCLAKDPSQRPSSVRQLLDHLIHQKLIPPPPPPPLRDPFYGQAWPKDKPIAEIVFYQLITIKKQPLTTLWVMMQSHEITQHISNTGYNNFLFTLTPHPMVLWVTAFYSKGKGARWLSSYLDLKKADSQKIIWQLAEAGSYPVLFFSKDFPNRYVASRRLHIAMPQQKLLKEWVLTARSFMPVGSSQTSKNMLKKELNDNLKPRMLW
ncbi:MAG: serine/threonine-protein kinase [Cyanobacteria bacterium P01_C01_bin.118]